VRDRRLTPPLWLALALAASCTGSYGTGVMITVVSTGAPPTSVVLTWLDADHLIFTRRIPDAGTLAVGEASRFTVFVETHGGGSRRLVVRGSIGDRQDSVGVAQIPQLGPGITSAEVTLRPGTLPDQDNDDIPDEIDPCPRTHDVDGRCPPQLDAALAPDDAAAPDGSGDAESDADAGAVDASPDARPSDAPDAVTPDTRRDARPAPTTPVAFAVGSFVKQAGPQQIVPHDLGLQPKVLLLWTTGGTDESYSAGWSYAVGLSDGPSGTNRSFSVGDQDQASSSRTSRRLAAKALSVIRSDQTVLAEADLTAWDRDRLFLTWTTNDATPALIHYVLIGGSLSAKVLAWKTATTTGPSQITGVGFKPALVMSFHAGADLTGAPPTVVAGASLGWGAMVASGPQWASAVVSPSGAAASTSRRVQHRDDALFMFSGDGAATREASFMSMDADGFSVVYRNDGPAAQVVSLALAGLPVMAGAFLKPDAPPPAIQSVGGLGFRPGLLLLSSFQAVAQNPPVIHARLGLGAADGFAQVSSALGDSAGLRPTSAGSLNRENRVFVKATPEAQAVEAEATLTSFQPDTFNLSWPTNDAERSELNYVTLGSP
jgi:hypothetical protein